MAPVPPKIARKTSKAQAIGDGLAHRVTQQKAVKSVRKPRSGLLDASIPRDATHLLELAQRNSTESPLLCLPPEIRNSIWEYAVGGLEIHIILSAMAPQMLAYQTCPIGTKDRLYPGIAIHLHKVCRQVYVEMAPFIYTLNTFRFSYASDMDRWVRYRPVGLKKLITSINISDQYFCTYTVSRCRTLRKHFPNIKRIGIEQSVVSWIIRPAESVAECKARVAEEVRGREGDGVVVELI